MTKIGPKIVTKVTSIKFNKKTITAPIKNAARKAGEYIQKKPLTLVPIMAIVVAAVIFTMDRTIMKKALNETIKEAKKVIPGNNVNNIIQQSEKRLSKTRYWLAKNLNINSELLDSVNKVQENLRNDSIAKANQAKKELRAKNLINNIIKERARIDSIKNVGVKEFLTGRRKAPRF